MELYPQLGENFNPQLKSELHKIGFTGFMHLNKEKRDGKVRLIWVYPIEGAKEWFTVSLVLENGQLYIDLYKNPLGQSFDKDDINGLLNYIQITFRKLDGPV